MTLKELTLCRSYSVTNRKISRRLGTEICNISIYCIRVSQNFDFFSFGYPFGNFFVASFLSFFPALLPSVPFPLHFLSGCHKKLGVNYWQILEMEAWSIIAIVGHFTTIFRTKPYNVYITILWDTPIQIDREIKLTTHLYGAPYWQEHLSKVTGNCLNTYMSGRMWGVKATTIPASGDRSLETWKKGWTNTSKGFLGVSEFKNRGRPHSLETIHQVDFNLVLTLGPRMGPVVSTYHGKKGKREIGSFHMKSLLIQTLKLLILLRDV